MHDQSLQADGFIALLYEVAKLRFEVGRGHGEIPANRIGTGSGIAHMMVHEHRDDDLSANAIGSGQRDRGRRRGQPAAQALRLLARGVAATPRSCLYLNRSIKGQPP